jgi:hypothetical protein
MLNGLLHKINVSQVVSRKKMTFYVGLVKRQNSSQDKLLCFNLPFLATIHKQAVV